MGCSSSLPPPLHPSADATAASAPKGSHSSGGSSGKPVASQSSAAYADSSAFYGRYIEHTDNAEAKATDAGHTPIAARSTTSGPHAVPELEEWLMGQETTAAMYLPQGDTTQSPAKVSFNSAQWNTQFQEALELPNSTIEEQTAKYLAILRIADDFVASVKLYGKVIIAELNSQVKTLQQNSKLGGIAGGYKFVVQGILFKVTHDSYLGEDRGYMYGGNQANEEFAAKAASHDLKGAVNYLRYFMNAYIKRTNSSDNSYLQVPRVPIQAVMDYMGYRLSALPLLPLQKLIYGSSDAGGVVECSVPHINRLMKEAGEALHLAPHSVVNCNDPLYSAIDTEVHQSHDGRFYMLDLARTFPPEASKLTPHLPSSPYSIFYRLLRPEYLLLRKQQGKPQLSSDAFSGFTANCKDAHAHNEAVREATQDLLEQVIPSYALELQKLDAKQSDEQFHEPLSENLHRRGINIRHLGCLRSHISTKDSSVSRTLLVEIVARTLKNMLRSWLRLRQQQPLPLPLPQPQQQPPSPSGSSKDDQDARTVQSNFHSEFITKQKIVAFLNLICETSPMGSRFWQEQVVPNVFRRFGVIALGEAEQNNLQQASAPLLFRIVVHMLHMIGTPLTDQAQKDMKTPISLLGFRFASSDVQEIQVRVKYISFIDFIKGKMYAIQAAAAATVAAPLRQPQIRFSTSSSTLAQTRARLLSLACTHFENALATDPFFEEALLERGVGSAQQYELLANEAKAVDEQNKLYAKSDLALTVTINQTCNLGGLSLARFIQISDLLLRTTLAQWQHRVSEKQLLQYSGATSLQMLRKLMFITDFINFLKKSRHDQPPQPQTSERKTAFGDATFAVVLKRLQGALLLADAEFDAVFVKMPKLDLSDYWTFPKLPLEDILDVNQLRQLDLSCTLIEEFELESASLESITCTACERLVKVHIVCPRLSALKLAQLPSLKHLDLSRCTALTDLESQQLSITAPELEFLSVADTAVKTVRLNLSKLKQLSCARCHELSSIQLECPALAKLDTRGCSAQQLGDIEKKCESVLGMVGLKNDDRFSTAPQRTIGQKKGDQPGEFEHPHGICFDSKNQRVAVVDTGNKRVQLFNSEWQLFKAFGSNDDLLDPCNVCIQPTTNHLLLTDYYRIRIYTDDGTKVSDFGTHGVDPGEFDNMLNIACDDKGRILVTEVHQHRFQICDESGKVIRVAGSFGTNAGQLMAPVAIFAESHRFGRSGRLFVLNKITRSISVWSNDGAQFITNVPVPSDNAPNAIHLDHFDRILVGTMTEFRVYDPTNYSLLQVVGCFGQKPGEFRDIRGLCVNDENTLIVDDYDNHRLQVF